MLTLLFSLFSSSKSDIVREKYEISAPETHAEKTSKIIINRKKSINSLNEENSHQLEKKYLRIWEGDRLSSGNY